MSLKPNVVALCIAAGILGGVLTHYIDPKVVHAQQQTPKVLTEPIVIPLVTGAGFKTGELHGGPNGAFTISINAGVSMHVDKTAKAAIVEFKRIVDSK